MRRMTVAVAMLACAGAALPVGMGLSGAATPIGVPLDAKVQPGGEIHIGNALCTLNFLFKGSDGNRYIGSAGHCAIEGSPVQSGEEAAVERSWAPGTGQVVKDVNDQRIGEFAYAVLDSTRDFSLIRLDPGVAASPEMAHFGGPTGINDDITADPVTMHWYGNGVGLGMVVPARSGVALGLHDPDHVYMLAAAGPGDSGSGVISEDGRAVGVLVAGGVEFGGVSDTGVDAGDIAITRLSPQLKRATEAIRVSFELVTAPLR